MAWTPTLNSARDEDLIANLLAIIVRDFKLALDVLYVGQDLPDFRERALGQIERLEFPCMAIGPRSNASSPSEGGGYLSQGFRVDIYIGVTADSTKNVTTKIMRYMTTMGEVLRAATKGDVFAGMAAQTFEYVLETEWEYGPIGNKESSIFRGAQLQATITVNAGKS